jgi:hypothetical protein
MSTYRSANEGLPRLARRTVFPEPDKTMAQVDADLRAAVEAARPPEETVAEQQAGAPAEVADGHVAIEGVAVAVTQPIQEV